MIEKIKFKLQELGFTKNQAPPGLRRENQFKKFFTEEEWNYIQKEKLKYKNIFEFFYLIMNNLAFPPKCLYCKNKAKYINYNKGYSKTCSNKICIQKYKKEKFNLALEKYKKKNNISDQNIKNISQINEIKLKKKNKGFDNKEIQEKIKKTNLEKYGVDNPFKSKEIQERIKKTNLEKYGTENPMKSNIIKNKSMKQKRKININVLKELCEYKDIILDENYYLNRKPNSEIRFICKKCKKEFFSLKPIFCPYCFSYKNTEPEKMLLKFLNELKNKYNIRFFINYRKFKKFELDFYLPEYNLGIEINGVYWHSTYFKEKNYHKDKLEYFEEKNIKLIQFFDFEIYDKFEIIKSMIQNHLKLNKRIYARHCNIREISENEANLFFEKNHIQGHVKSKYYFGLFFNNKLIQAISLSKPRYNKNYNLEIIRFSSLLNYNIIGGFSKLLKFIDRKFNNPKIISYGNRRWTNKFNNVYLKTGFNLIRISPPNYFYYKNGKIISRIQAQKYKLKNFLKYFDESKTEIDNMLDNNYFQIYDCGNLVFEYI